MRKMNYQTFYFQQNYTFLISNQYFFSFFLPKNKKNSFSTSQPNKQPSKKTVQYGGFNTREFLYRKS